MVAGYKSRGLPLPSVMVIDYFSWAPTYVAGDYLFDPNCWPDPKGMVKQLGDQGVQVMVSTYSNFVSNKSVNWAAASAEKGAASLLVQNTSTGEPLLSGFVHTA